jgi:hypothetical protein
LEDSSPLVDPIKHRFSETAFEKLIGGRGLPKKAILSELSLAGIYAMLPDKLTKMDKDAKRATWPELREPGWMGKKTDLNIIRGLLDVRPSFDSYHEIEE